MKKPPLPSPREVTRRAFLGHTAQASVALGLLLGGCDEGGSAEPSSDAATADALTPDALIPDALTPDTALADAEAPDTGTPDAGTPDAEGPDASTPSPLDLFPDAPIVKGPWVHIVGDEALLLFESQPGHDATLTVTAGGGVMVDVPLSQETSTVDFKWPAFPERLEFGDHPGDYTVWAGRIADLRAGETHRWVVQIADTTVEGAFRAPPPAGQPCTVAWISDTMWPGSTLVSALLAEHSPDLVLHGGDIQYLTNPGDTWNGMFQIFAPLMRRAPLQLCVGNHEYEDQNEFDVQYMRLFGRQAPPGARRDLHVVDYGGVRFVMMNSELDHDSPDQVAWLEARLEEVAQSPALRRAVVCFHRPLYTFSKSSANRSARAVLHPIFQRHGVPLVLAGHNHCYERFDVDGMVYITDGGGGAFTYDVDASLADAQANHPEEIPLRTVVEQTHGVTIMRIEADGALTVERWNIDGARTDRFVIPA